MWQLINHHEWQRSIMYQHSCQPSWLTGVNQLSITLINFLSSSPATNGVTVGLSPMQSLPCATRTLTSLCLHPLAWFWLPETWCRLTLRSSQCCLGLCCNRWWHGPRSVADGVTWQVIDEGYWQLIDSCQSWRFMWGLTHDCQLWWW